MNKPKMLVFDVETAPIIAHVWGIWDQNVGLNMIKSDWHILSYAAKWHGDKKVMYQDQRKATNIENDKEILKGIWKLLDQADIVITQNGKAFDVKKLNARFIMNGMKPPSTYRHIDTKVLAKKYFAFTSNKLEFMTDKLCTKYKKLKHKQFPGFEMWEQCLKGNLKAWKAMEKYNKYDVLSLEELYNKIAPWDTSINFSVYATNQESICSCGSKDFHKNGYAYTSTGKYQRFSCKKCGAEIKSKTNELSARKKVAA